MDDHMQITQGVVEVIPEADYRTGHIGRGLGPGSLWGPGKHGVK